MGILYVQYDRLGKTNSIRDYYTIIVVFGSYSMIHDYWLR